MKNPFCLFCALCLAAAAASGQTPTITAVQNAASYIPAGLPNSGIAQGSLFVVKGTNLGPANLAIATQFPLPPAIGGTSVTVTIGATTVNAVMYYSLAAQIAAILPSKTPTGTGTVKVTYNGQSASAAITVVQSSLGIFTVSQSGVGDAIAFLNADSALITPSHAANPGDVVVFWGTGLGAVGSDETQPAVQADLTNIPLRVFIGGQTANILFRGRNACCSSVDTVYVTIPNGVSGCAVSVIMQIGNVISNSTSIAVASSGRACVPLSQNSTTGGTGTHSYGGFTFQRVVESIAAAGTNTTIKTDTAGGSFVKVTFPNNPPQGSQLDINSYGSCSVSVFSVNGKPVTQPSGASVQFLDAGPSIALAAPFGNRTIPKSTQGTVLTYQTLIDQTATTLVPGQYTFTGTGGPDVGPFTAPYTMPPIFTWTNQSSVTNIVRANGVTVTWTGGDPSGYVTISGMSTSYGQTAATTVTVTFSCTAPVSAGSFTVPPAVLLALPATNNIPGTNFPATATLSLTSTTGAQAFPPPAGIEAAATTSSFVYLGSVAYQ